MTSNQPNEDYTETDYVVDLFHSLVGAVSPLFRYATPQQTAEIQAVVNAMTEFHLSHIDEAALMEGIEGLEAKGLIETRRMPDGEVQIRMTEKFMDLFGPTQTLWKRS